MSPRTTAEHGNAYRGLLLVLLSSVSVVVSISSILYAIQARTYVDRFSVRLATLESRCRCDTPSEVVISKDDVTLGQGTPKQLSTLLHQKRKLLKRSTELNREFMDDEEDEAVSRADRRQGSRRRSGQTPRLRGGHQQMTAGTHQPLAMHFDGNASKYYLGHRHYEGNGRLRHPDGILKDWRMKDWGVRIDRQHRLHENDGTLMMRESGIYFVYAQVYYLDDHDINGFRILVNESPVLQCTTMTHGEPLTKANTCFTGGMVELHAGDVLSLRDLAALRYSVFEPGKSFFGLFRVAQHMSGGREGP